MKIYILWYFRDKLTNADRGYAIDFTVTAANPKQARRLAHQHPMTGGRIEKELHWFKKEYTRVKVIGDSLFSTPRVHSYGEMSEWACAKVEAAVNVH